MAIAYRFESVHLSHKQNSARIDCIVTAAREDGVVDHQRVDTFVDEIGIWCSDDAHADVEYLLQGGVWSANWKVSMEQVLSGSLASNTHQCARRRHPSYFYRCRR